MSEAVELWEKPEAETIYMIAGWRQWADAGSISSGLPKYLVQQVKAKKIGRIRPDGFYFFQIPGTHDLVRPVIKFDEGYPKSLDTPNNDIYYVEQNGKGIVFFLGEEPHLDIERYITAMLYVCTSLGVKRIISLGGVYGELPYNKERVISAIYSLKSLKGELDELAVSLSDYSGGASIGSFLCKRAGDQNIEHIGFYAFAPTYDFSSISQFGNAIRIENDFMAWLGVMRRINHMLKLNFDLSDLEKKQEELIETVDKKVDELESKGNQVGIREYLDSLANEFEEIVFDPLDDVWEDEIRRIFDDPEVE